MFGLERTRVIEVGTAVSIPLVGAALSNLGAEVIKIESRQRLDINRARVPRATPDGEATALEAFPLLHELNPAKKSVTLNLKTDEGRDLFRQLLAESDVFIENYAPGWLDRLGMSWDQLHALNPRLIMLAASAYGEEGPLHQQRAYAPIMTGLAGLEGLIGYEDGATVGMLATALSDPNAAYFGLLAVLAALLDRKQSGRGCLIDLSQTEAAASVLGIAFAEHELTGETPRPHGNEHPNRAPHDFYRCVGEDAWVALSVRDDRDWCALVMVVDNPALAAAEFTTTAGRRAHKGELDRLLGAWTATRTPEAVSGALQDAGVPCTPVLGVTSLETSEHFAHRGLTTTVGHPLLGEMDVTGTPWQFDGIPLRPRAAGPVLSTDTRDVMCDVLGLDQSTYDRYEAAGVFE